MEVAAIIAAVNAASQLLAVLIPQLEQAFKNGQISPEQQQVTWNNLAALRDQAKAFSGPEWQPSAPPTPPASPS